MNVHVKAVSAALLIACFVLPARAGAAASAPAPDCDRTAGAHPVLLVHGYAEKPEDLDRRWRATVSTITAGQGHPVRFDYTATDHRWVDDPTIGPKLATVISCLAQVSQDAGGPGQVAVVAHSMGGLAAREALARTGPDGEAVASHVAFVVTIATPHDGAFYTDTERVLLRPVLAGLCATANPFLCWAGAAGSGQAGEPAVVAMGRGSTQLASLPAMPATLGVSVVGNDFAVRTSVFKWHHDTHVPDPFVPLASALSQRQRPDLGGEAVRVACTADLAFVVFDAFNSLYDIACTHGAVIDTAATQDLIGRNLSRWVNTVPPESFYGEWGVHGGHTVLRPDGTGTSRNHVGFTASGEWLDEVAELTTKLADGHTKLVVTVTDAYFAANGVRSPNSVSSYPLSIAVGDTFELRFEHPHLIRVTPSKTGSTIGNPYLCGDGLSAEYQDLCGA